MQYKVSPGHIKKGCLGIKESSEIGNVWGQSSYHAGYMGSPSICSNFSYVRVQREARATKVWQKVLHAYVL